MKIEKVNCLVSAITEKINSNTREPYWSVSIVTLDGEGSSFNIVVKDKILADRLEPMSRYNVNLNLSSSQYGLKLEFNKGNPVNEDLGSII